MQFVIFAKELKRAAKNEIELTQNINKIIQLVSTICNLFPSWFPSICKRLVQEYIPVIVQYLELEIEHLKICQRFELCSTGTSQTRLQQSN
jgi:hypothetical protein